MRVALCLLGPFAWFAACAHPVPEPVSSPPVATKIAKNQPPASDAVEPEPSEAPAPWGIRGEDYPSVVKKVTAMVNDRELSERVGRRGLHVVNVAWEDTGRAWGSALGPNISDLTLQVRYRDAERPDIEQTALMPVFRFPDFADHTGDIARNRFFVRTGNQKKNAKLSTVALDDVLRNLRAYLSRPGSLKGSGSFTSARDTHFLVAAQAVFLPIPSSGKAEFNPVVFNYQSAPGSPAVLSLLVTRQGTSVRVIENEPEESSVAGWGQELYFNAHGERAAFDAERRSRVSERIAAAGGPKNEDEASALESGADVVFLIQVPLVHKQWGALGGLWGSGTGSGFGAGGLGLSGAHKSEGGTTLGHGAGVASDVERAVIGHGKSRGRFEETSGFRLERDARFPIRITVQFYKATSNGVVSDADLDAISKNIGSVYEHADFVGSLVLPNDDPRRPTAWQSVPGEWFPW